MLPEQRTPTYPGEVLAEEFLKPLDLTQVALAKNIGVPVRRVNEIVRGKRGITPEAAWLLSMTFETTVPIATDPAIAHPRSSPSIREVHWAASPCAPADLPRAVRSIHRVRQSSSDPVAGEGGRRRRSILRLAGSVIPRLKL